MNIFGHIASKLMKGFVSSTPMPASMLATMPCAGLFGELAMQADGGAQSHPEHALAGKSASRPNHPSPTHSTPEPNEAKTSKMPAQRRMLNGLSKPRRAIRVHSISLLLNTGGEFTR